MVGLCQTRRMGMLAACAVSVGVGMSLVWHLVPEALRQVNTAELLAVLGLIMLPGATVFAFAMERQTRRGMARVEVGEASHNEQGEVRGADGAWEAVWAAVMTGEGGGQAAALPGAGGAGRREGSGSRRPGVDAGSRRRREDVVGAGVVSGR